MNLPNSTTQFSDLLELYDAGYQIGYKEAIVDLQKDIEEEPAGLASFCTDYIKTESVDLTNQKDFEDYMLQYSYRLLSQYIK